jgi:hypothetical protein
MTPSTNAPSSGRVVVVTADVDGPDVDELLAPPPLHAASTTSAHRLDRTARREDTQGV